MLSYKIVFFIEHKAHFNLAEFAVAVISGKLLSNLRSSQFSPMLSSGNHTAGYFIFKPKV